ncbi:MAG TPA: ABC transporter permease [Candidatus Sulfotelmatobacter sp.]|nr:ABC transporter permease [Candidatus Sulfotelmatobacter sp.]
MNDLLQDVRYAFRQLRKTPGFAIVVVLTLALGIGANTSIFSVVSAVLLRPLPYSHPDKLVAVKDEIPGANLKDAGMSEPEWEDLQNRSGVFDEVSPTWPIDANVTGREKPQRVEGLAVGLNYFEMLSTKAALGRVFLPSDYRAGLTEAAVISDSLWKRMFGGDPNAIGQAVRLDGDLYTVIGVLPPDFRHPGPTLQQNVDIWISGGFVADPFPKPPRRNARLFPGAIARIKPDLTLTQAQAQIDTFVQHLQQEYPNDYPASARWNVRLLPLQQELVGNTGRMLLLLLASVGAVLIIACANIASLLLARSSSRQGEIAIRQALGANAARLIRQTLTESLVLSFLGGACALALSFALKQVLLRFLPASLPRLSEVTLDWRALVFAFAASIVTGLLFGMAPALQLSSPRMILSLRQGTRSVGMAMGQHRFLSALVMTEFALSLVLVVGAGLLLRSFWNVLKADPGMDPTHMVMARVWLPVPNDPKQDPYGSTEKKAAFIREVLRRTEAIPGVERAAMGFGQTPFLKRRTTVPFQIEGRAQSPGERVSAEFSAISPEFFRTLGIPMLRGRAFTDSDNENGAKVAVVDQTTAELYFPGQDPMNQRVTFNIAPPNGGPVTFVIAGVVGRLRSEGLDQPYSPHVFVPIMQFPNNALDVYIRTAASADAMEDPVRQAIQSVDPTLPVFGVRTLESIVSDSLASRRFTMQLLGVFAGGALLLAAIGIYGVMAFFVGQRVREIGIRMALGALPGDMRKLVVAQGMKLAVTGVTAGIVISLAVTRLMATLLFGINAYDPLTLIGITALLISVALLANFIPASRAAKIDPMVALRYE